jgi:hypothetical protein
MAGIESNGFPLWAQPAHLCFVSIPHTVPMRVAHAPPRSAQLNSFLHPGRRRVCPRLINCRIARHCSRKK